VVVAPAFPLGKNRFLFSKNPGNANKIRIPDSSACTGYVSMPPNSAGQNRSAYPASTRGLSN
jgi:hypothetical protein